MEYINPLSRLYLVTLRDATIRFDKVEAIEYLGVATRRVNVPGQPRH